MLSGIPVEDGVCFIMFVGIYQLFSKAEIQTFDYWKLWAQFWAPPVPTWGKVLAHVENAACPTRASVLPIS